MWQKTFKHEHTQTQDSFEELILEAIRDHCCAKHPHYDALVEIGSELIDNQFSHGRLSKSFPVTVSIAEDPELGASFLLKGMARKDKLDHFVETRLKRYQNVKKEELNIPSSQEMAFLKRTSSHNSGNGGRAISRNSMALLPESIGKKTPCVELRISEPQSDEVVHYEITVGRPQKKNFMPTAIPTHVAHSTLEDIQPLPECRVGSIEVG